MPANGYAGANLTTGGIDERNFMREIAGDGEHTIIGRTREGDGEKRNR